MRVYYKEFKEEAIKLSCEIGPKAATDQLGIPVTTLYSWRTQIKQYGSIAFVGSGNPRLDLKTAETKGLEKKIKELEVANDIFILKKALAFFAGAKRNSCTRNFQFIRVQKKNYSVKTMRNVLKASEAGYYK